MAFAVSHPREIVRGGEGRDGELHWKASAESITWKLLIRGALNSYWTAQNGNLMPDLGVDSHKFESLPKSSETSVSLYYYWRAADSRP